MSDKLYVLFVFIFVVVIGYYAVYYGVPHFKHTQKIAEEYWSH